MPDITGTIRPAGAATVTVADTRGLSRTVKPDTTTGVFTISNLPIGNYTLAFTPSPGYNRPAERLTSTVRGLTTDIGVVTLQGNGTVSRGGGSWTANGSSYTGFFATGAVSPVTGHASVYLSTLAQGGGELVKLAWDGNFRGLGTYSFGVAPGQTIAGYSNPAATYGGLGLAYWTSPAAGSVTVSRFDAVNGILAGTFSFQAAGSNQTPGSQTVAVTAGSFSLRYVPRQ
ncbi:hypothetical protein DLM85_05000 [Hymenobacter edaphi]|uniref:Uncharacterized protein n=1 Tax=Hymenobacter edaphi TaxID=2211146 RepID=A0A328BSW8_9BACT|nr:hypothetical protein DLM85_05000 [Hymenobacter edaphi]